MKPNSQVSGPVVKAGRWSAIALGGALLFSIGGANLALAGDPLGPVLGTVNMTLSTYPGAPTSPNGGGPFQLTLASPSPANLLTSLGIPTSVQAWCVEISEHITPGNLNTGVQLLSEGVSQVGGAISEGLKFLNIVSGSGTSGSINFTTAGTTALSSFIALGWDASEVGAALQDVIWLLQLANPLPSTIGDQNASQTTSLLNFLQNYALTNQTGYYRLHQDGLQDQVFAVPGPLAGAGLPGLLLASAALLALARRRQKTA